MSEKSAPVPPASGTPVSADGGGQVPEGSASTGGASAPAAPTGDPVPHWLPERLDRAKGQGKKELLEALGFTSEKQALEALKKLKELENVQLSELERAKREAEEQKARAEALEARLREREQIEQQVAAQNALKNAAIAAGVKNDVIKYVQLDLGQYIESTPALKALWDAGQEIPPALLEPFFTKLKTANPYFFEGVAQPATTGPVTPTPPQTPPPGGILPPAEDFTRMADWKKRGAEKYGVHV